MRIFSTLLFLFAFSVSFSQSVSEKSLKTEIKEVTVFLKGAQVFEKGSVNLELGKIKVLINGLSPNTESQSVQVKGIGDFTILSVNSRLNYLSELSKSNKYDSLQNLINMANYKIANNIARDEVLNEKLNLLFSNRTQSTGQGALNLDQLRAAMNYFETEITKVKAEQIKIKNDQTILQEEVRRYKRQLLMLNTNLSQPNYDVEILVESNSRHQANFELSYLVSEAGWIPKYDVRVTDINNPLELNYKAEVYQRTGVEWKNVKLKFSNGNPNESGVLPELKTWFLNFASNTTYLPKANQTALKAGQIVYGLVRNQSGEPVPAASVKVMGNNVSTMTGPDGRFSLALPANANVIIVGAVGYQQKNITVNQSQIIVVLEDDVRMLSEVVVTGYTGIEKRSVVDLESANAGAKIPVSTVLENQTTVEFELETPYTIGSNGETQIIDLAKYPIEAIYEYYAVPKLDKDAFLMARIVNWDQYNLIEGEANLYFEDAYVGRSILDAGKLTDTLDISLGRDKNIVISREKMETFSRRRTIGSNQVDSRGFKITVRNRKNSAITINIYDQIPVAVISEISVSTTELSKGVVDDKIGRVHWQLNVPAQQQTELNIAYEVRYPRREKVILE
jgi:hypothetical protein